jgi:hypothetical protein
MRFRFSRIATAVALMTGIFAGTAALASDAFTDAMQEAYAPYRVALFRTNSNAQPESQQAVAQAQQAWAKLTSQFAAKPPAPYDRDASFARSLDEVAKVYAKAGEQVGANQLSAAHETLEAARDIMAELRHRNQVIVYSDHMNAYHAEMEEVLINGPKLLAGPNGMLQLTAKVGALEYLAKKLSAEAPVNLAKDPDFDGLVKPVVKSVTDLQAALWSQDTQKIKEAMDKVKQPYSKFFLKFG